MLPVTLEVKNRFIFIGNSSSRTYKQLQGNYFKIIIFHCILLDTFLNCMIYVLSILISTEDRILSN